MSETMAVRWGTTLPRITPIESADWEELGRHLNSRRAELGWSRRQAAERAEVSQSTWNKLENAKTRSVRQETLTKIALALNPDDPERANAERRTLYRLAGVPLREPISANSEVTTDVRLAIVGAGPHAGRPPASWRPGSSARTSSGGCSVRAQVPRGG